MLSLAKKKTKKRFVSLVRPYKSPNKMCILKKVSIRFDVFGNVVDFYRNFFFLTISFFKQNHGQKFANHLRTFLGSIELNNSKQTRK